MKLATQQVVLVDACRNKVTFEGALLGQSYREDDYYFAVGIAGVDERSLVFVDHRDAEPQPVSPHDAEAVIRGLFAAGDRELAAKITEALELTHIVHDLRL